MKGREDRHPELSGGVGVGGWKRERERSRHVVRKEKPRLIGSEKRKAVSRASSHYLLRATSRSKSTIKRRNSVARARRSKERAKAASRVATSSLFPL